MNMNAMDRQQAAAMQETLRGGRYIATWLELYPDSTVLSPVDPADLLRIHHSQTEELTHTRLQAQRQRDALERNSVQAVLWLRERPLFSWPPLRRLISCFLQACRRRWGKHPQKPRHG